ncbi:hypothetical protein [Photobacterium angustum]|uniref:hypothetical protein n=1 Tax=Photobacterium angustum TaxID=661 RepID=UPI002013012C|nr:hypothetical protein [Photobacterium angustum]
MRVFLSTLFFFMSVTGLTLYANVCHLDMEGLFWLHAEWVTYAMGGLVNARE